MKRCFYCGRALDTPALRRPNSRTKDHLVPRRYGHRREPRSLIVDACLECNRAKADMTLAEFRAVRGVTRFPGEKRHRRLVQRAEEWVNWIHTIGSWRSE